MRKIDARRAMTASACLLMALAFPIDGHAVDVSVAMSAPADPPASAGQTIGAIMKRGQIACGVRAQTLGFAHVDGQGNWRGLDVDLCRAVAATIFGDARKTRHVQLDATSQLSALQSGEIDMVPGVTAVSLPRGTARPVDVVGISYYDRQGFLVRRESAVRSVGEMQGLSVCVERGTPAESNVVDYSIANGVTFRLVAIEKLEDVRAALFAGRCDVMAADLSQLQATRIAYAPNPHDFRLLPQTISMTARGPAIRTGDSQFAGIVRRALDAVIGAEEFDITSRNVDAMLTNNNPAIQKFLGVAAGGRAPAAQDKSAYAVIRQVGNYGESYDRHLGVNSQLKISRGLNMLSSQGGMLYAPSLH